MVEEHTSTSSGQTGEGAQPPPQPRDPEEAAQAAYNECIAHDFGEEAAKYAAELARKAAVEFNRMLEERAQGTSQSGDAPAPRVVMADGGTQTPQKAPVVATNGNPLLQTLQVVTAQMPEKYDGVSDLRTWFRRFEADATAAGWDDRMMAERLGGFFRDSYFDTWDENAKKASFAEDRRIMLQMFDLIRPDEALEKFNALTWDAKGHVSQFMALLNRTLEEYDKMLPQEERLPPPVKKRMILDRLIASAPEGARPVLRRRRPKEVAEVCQIIEDYRGKQPKAARPVAAGTIEEAPAAPAAVGQIRPEEGKQWAALMESQTKAIKEMHSSQNALLGSLKDLLKNQQAVGGVGPARAPGGQVPGARADGGRPRRPLLPCQGKHATYNCPHKKYPEGCYICGARTHLSRQCPERAALVEQAKKGPSGAAPGQGN